MAKSQKGSKKLESVKIEKKQAVLESVKIGSARGIESMYRNSYRAQLDMIALAATKANIMISLNGLLVSMLLLSGAYFLTSDTLLLVPVALFLLTCTIAIVFAVLAARPDMNRTKKTLEDFRTGNAQLLIFDQFATLSAPEFDVAMKEMMQENGRVYTSMTEHIYELGCMANKKFSRLYISYNSFIIGLVISVASLLLVIIYRTVYPLV
ncbi:MAG: Pycsar system effector family protein [Granulosicoccus sp.]